MKPVEAAHEHPPGAPTQHAEASHAPRRPRGSVGVVCPRVDWPASASRRRLKGPCRFSFCVQTNRGVRCHALQRQPPTCPKARRRLAEMHHIGALHRRAPRAVHLVSDHAFVSDHADTVPGHNQARVPGSVRAVRLAWLAWLVTQCLHELGALNIRAQLRLFRAADVWLRGAARGGPTSSCAAVPSRCVRYLTALGRRAGRCCAGFPCCSPQHAAGRGQRPCLASLSLSWRCADACQMPCMAPLVPGMRSRATGARVVQRRQSERGTIGRVGKIDGAAGVAGVGQAGRE